MAPEASGLRYLLDTHLLVWWYEDSPRLPPRHRRLLERAESEGGRVAVSAISLWEIAKLVEIGRLRLTLSIDECLADVEGNPGIAVLPITGRVAVESTRLGERFPRDPADQVIAATARCHALTLLTVDDRIRSSGAVAVL